jgi:diguanylate cyclase (GGDEF)-like protein
MAQPVLPAVLEDAGPERSRRTPARPRALVAGLDAKARRASARWLASAGLEVDEAASVADALRRLEERRPDVVLADMALRDEQGRGLTRCIRERPDDSDLPVLALCGSRRQSAAAIEESADDRLEQPFDWRLAAERAERLIHLAQTRRDLRGAREEIERLRQLLGEERRGRVVDHFDALTGLPDLERLEHALERALAIASGTSQVALALFDIEHLVMVNTRLGRARTNSVLQQFAQRLVATLRSDELRRACAGGLSLSMPARVGGGVFAAMLTGLSDRADAKAAVSLLLERLSGRYRAGDEDIVLATSVGVAMAPADGLSAEMMLQKAELAACEAVETGVVVRFYGQSTNPFTERSRQVIRLLSDVLSRNELELHYQPFFKERAAHIGAAEALLRWTSPVLGSVSPSEFIPLAEEAGVMVPIGTWVLRTALRQVRTWLDQGLPPCRVAVNVSLCQLVRGDLAQVVREALSAARVDPCLLELELSERGVLRNDPDILRQLQVISDLGVRLAIDDFGTGNSAISYLKQFPIDVLKIDQSFVRGLADSAEDAAITSATIAMARQLGLEVVAEGVEEPPQMEFLRRHGCGEYQGFLFSPAVPPDALAALLRRGPLRFTESTESRNE